MDGLLLTLIIGFILGIAITSYSIKKSEWFVYKPDKFIWPGGVVVVLYYNGALHASRDRNAIAWINVKNYCKL